MKWAMSVLTVSSQNCYLKLLLTEASAGSTIVTTNLAFSEWTNLFENTAMVAALVDRLAFRSYILDMNGASYRLDHSKNGA